MMEFEEERNEIKDDGHSKLESFLLYLLRRNEEVFNFRVIKRAICKRALMYIMNYKTDVI